MNRLKIRRFWQTRRQNTVAILAGLCLLRLMPVGYGQTDHVSQLINQLKDPGTEARAQAASELGDTKDARAVEALIAALNRHEFVGPIRCG